MRIIHTILRNGQCLMPEVMQGVLDNNCILMPTTSNSNYPNPHDRQNMIDNWNEAFRYCDKYFIGIDSDVVLEKNLIESMMQLFDNSDMVIAKIKKKGTLRGHSVFVASKKVIDSIKIYFLDGHCPTCNWVKRIRDSGLQISYIDAPNTYEVERVSVRKF